MPGAGGRFPGGPLRIGITAFHSPFQPSRMSDQPFDDPHPPDVGRRTVFVVGYYRSGTSLLYTLLNQHPEVSLMYEAHPWCFPWFHRKGMTEPDWLERLECYAGTLSRHALNASMLHRMGVESPDGLYDAFAAKSGASIRGEKSPAYADRVAALMAANPQARLILIWRDPAAIMDSILRAAATSRFFRKRGMLFRLIHAMEAMARDAAALVAAGVPVFQVSYDDLVDRTEATCRALCDFLSVPWNPEMASLEHADLSAVFHDRQHAQLRRRAIVRTEEAPRVAPAARRVLLAYETRWRRLRGLPSLPDAQPEPGPLPRSWHRLLGHVAATRDGLIDRYYASAPLSWLKAWRTLRDWSASAPPVPASPVRRRSVAMAVLLVIGTAALDTWSGAMLTLAPLYMLATVLASLGATRRTGLAMAAFGAVSWSAAQGWAFSLEHGHTSLALPLVWNSAMRFLLLGMVAVLVAFVRDTHGVRPAADERPA